MEGDKQELPTKGADTKETYLDEIMSERARASMRRANKELGLTAVRRDENAQWGLALSGGGIRSATFCLGVLQALSRMPAKSLAMVNGNGLGGPPTVEATHDSLLAQFDYMSTVSGGGYIGVFFGSLFIPNRLAVADKTSPQQQSNLDAAKAAYEVLTCDPPPRMRESLRSQCDKNEGRSMLAMSISRRACNSPGTRIPAWKSLTCWKARWNISSMAKRR